MSYKSKNQNAWSKPASQKQSRAYNNKNDRSRHNSNRSDASQRSSTKDSMWEDVDEHFPSLGGAPMPPVNVWKERMAKAEMVKAMEPLNENDEEAMLQWALELSKQEAAAEKQKIRKLEEEYKFQEAALEIHPEFLETVPSATGEACVSQCEKQSQDARDSVVEVAYSEPSASSSGYRKGKLHSFEKNNCPRSNFDKIIDRFGGWGLGDQNSASNRISNFVDDVLQDNFIPDLKTDSRMCNNSQARSTKFNEPRKENVSKVQSSFVQKDSENLHHQTVIQNNSKSVNNYDARKCDNFKARSSELSKSCTDDKEKVSSSKWGKNGNLLDGKGTFTDLDEENNFALDHQSSVALTDLKINKNVKNESDSLTDRKFNKDENQVISPSLDVNSDHISKSPTRFDVDLENKGDHISSAVTINSGLTDLSHNNFLSLSHTDPSLSIPPEHEILNAIPFVGERKVSNSQPNPVCKEKQDLENKVETSFTCDQVSLFDLDEEIDLEPLPILPPKPISSAINLHNDNFCDSNSVSKSQQSDLSMPQTQNKLPFVPPIFPCGQHPFMSPLMANPAMFPGLPNPMNPMMGCVMDPLMARQMFLLSNPFFASQFLAMERQAYEYNLPGMPMNVPMMQPQVPTSHNSLGAVMDAPCLNVHPALEQQFENKCQKPSSNPMLSKLQSPPGLSKNQPNSCYNSIDKDWFDCYLPKDSSSVIPPPKPASCSATESVICYGTDTSVPAMGNSRNSESYELSPALQAQVTKTEVGGWSDTEDEVPSKSASGWNEDEEPSKYLKSAGRGVDYRKPVCRQPTRQPHLSRCQQR